PRPCDVRPMSTRPSACVRPGVGASAMALAAVKIVEFAPMPMASDNTATAVKPGVRRRRRRASRRFRRMWGITGLGGFGYQRIGVDLGGRKALGFALSTPEVGEASMAWSWVG